MVKQQKKHSKKKRSSKGFKANTAEARRINASTGYKCFEDGGEKLYRIWMKAGETKEDDLF